MTVRTNFQKKKALENINNQAKTVTTAEDFLLLLIACANKHNDGYISRKQCIEICGSVERKLNIGERILADKYLKTMGI